MNWSRIKSILLACLIVVNLFLGVQIYLRQSENNRLTPEMIADTVTLLSDAGITMDPQLIPRQNPQIQVYEAELPSDLNEYYRSIVQARTGELADSLRMHMMVNGIRITVRDTNDLYEFYTSDLLSFYFCDGSYLEQDPIGRVTQSEIEWQEMDDAALELRLNELLFGRTFSQRSDVEEAGYYGVRIVSGVKTAEGAYILRCAQYMDGFMIRDCTAVCIIYGDRLIAGKGSLIFAQHGAGYSVSYSDAVNMLLTARADRRSRGDSTPTEITDISNLYCVNWSTNRRIMYLIPAWEITYDGQNKQIIDGINCKIRE